MARHDDPKKPYRRKRIDDLEPQDIDSSGCVDLKSWGTTVRAGYWVKCSKLFSTEHEPRKPETTICRVVHVDRAAGKLLVNVFEEVDRLDKGYFPPDMAWRLNQEIVQTETLVECLPEDLLEVVFVMNIHHLQEQKCDIMGMETVFLLRYRKKIVNNQSAYVDLPVDTCHVFPCQIPLFPVDSCFYRDVLLSMFKIKSAMFSIMIGDRDATLQGTFGHGRGKVGVNHQLWNFMLRYFSRSETRVAPRSAKQSAKRGRMAYHGIVQSNGEIDKTKFLVFDSVAKIQQLRRFLGRFVGVGAKKKIPNYGKKKVKEAETSLKVFDRVYTMVPPPGVDNETGSKSFISMKFNERTADLFIRMTFFQVNLVQELADSEWAVEELTLNSDEARDAVSVPAESIPNVLTKGRLIPHFEGGIYQVMGIDGDEVELFCIKHNSDPTRKNELLVRPYNEMNLHLVKHLRNQLNK